MTNENRPAKSSGSMDSGLIVSLYEISTAINALMDVDSIAGIVIEHCLKRIEAEQGMVYLLDREDDQKKYKTFLRGFSGDSDQIPFHLNQSLAAIILKGKKVLMINNPESNPIVKHLSLDKFGIKSLLAAPLITRQGIIGIIVLVKKKSTSGFSDPDKRFLGIVGTQVAKVIEAAHLQKEENKLIALKEELNIAHAIQKKFLPTEGMDNEHCQITGINIPAKDLGGDFYDIVKISDESVFVSLGDVMGKGIPAALIMSNAMAVIRSHLNRAGKYFLAEIADSLNNMVHVFTPPGQFITTLFGEYVCGKNSFDYINAGHPPLIAIRSDGRIESPPEDKNDMAIGILPDTQFSINKISLNPCDKIFIYSDGVTECFNRSGEEYGVARLKAFLKYNRTKDPEELSRLLTIELDNFRGATERSDDITFLVIESK